MPRGGRLESAHLAHSQLSPTPVPGARASWAQLQLNHPKTTLRPPMALSQPPTPTPAWAPPGLPQPTPLQPTHPPTRTRPPGPPVLPSCMSTMGHLSLPSDPGSTTTVLTSILPGLDLDPCPRRLPHNPGPCALTHPTPKSRGWGPDPHRSTQKLPAASPTHIPYCKRFGAHRIGWHL